MAANFSSQGFQQTGPSGPFRNAPIQGIKIPTIVVEPNEEEVHVVISHVEPDGTVFVQLIKWAAAFNDLMSKLNVEMDKVPPGRRTASPGKGLYCAAKSPSDDTWYRATVVDTLSTGDDYDRAAVDNGDDGDDSKYKH
jgi:hypothetical protein